MSLFTAESCYSDKTLGGVMKRFLALILPLSACLLIYQNCGNKSFSVRTDSQEGLLSQEGDTNTPDPDLPTVCDPLTSPTQCDMQSSSGLKGKIYYLTPEQHNSFFNNDLNNAKLDDYKTYGIKVPVNLALSSVNVTPRSWDVGFAIDSNNFVVKENGEKLFEWFHIDVSGSITLPEGDYQFATLSDDGMRVTIDDQVIINDDGVHSASYKCANQMISFSKNQKRKIRVEYFQGPRFRISMQLLVRPSSLQNQNCGASGQLSEIPAEAFAQ